MTVVLVTLLLLRLGASSPGREPRKTFDDALPCRSIPSRPNPMLFLVKPLLSSSWKLFNFCRQGMFHRNDSDGSISLIHTACWTDPGTRLLSRELSVHFDCRCLFLVWAASIAFFVLILRTFRLNVIEMPYWLCLRNNPLCVEQGEFRCRVMTSCLRSSTIATPSTPSECVGFVSDHLV